MSELNFSEFVYEKSHVKRHVKSDAQKVNFFLVNELRPASLFGYKYHLCLQTVVSLEANEYIFREIYCLHQVISLDNKMATRSSYFKVHFVGEKGCPIFRRLFTTKAFKSHVNLHVKSDAQKVLGK